MVPRPETRVFDELYGNSFSAPGHSWRFWKAPGKLREGSGRLWRAPGASGRLWQALAGSGKLRGALGGSGELQGVAGGSRDVCRGAVAASFVQKCVESGSGYVRRYIENILLGGPLGERAIAIGGPFKGARVGWAGGDTRSANNLK